MMKLVILPLTVPGSKGKQEMLEKVVDPEQIIFQIRSTGPDQLLVIADRRSIYPQYWNYDGNTGALVQHSPI